MSFLVCEELSPSQIGPATTRMSLARMPGWSRGHSSVSQPCSRMSGQTPVATSWSTRRTSSTATPCLRMIAALASTSPWVLLTSGLRLSVQLTKVAFRPVKSKSVWCSTVSVIGGLSGGDGECSRSAVCERTPNVTWPGRHILVTSQAVTDRGRLPTERVGATAPLVISKGRPMHVTSSWPALLGTSALTLTTAVLALGGAAQAAPTPVVGHVYQPTNDATGNAVAVFDRHADGSL